MPAVAVRSLYKIFGRKARQAVPRLAGGVPREEVGDLGVTAAVIDVSFEVRPGEIFVVMGLSGSGKSTLIRMLNGLLPPTSGTVEVDGTDLGSLRPAELRRLRREKISMVFQHFALLPHRTVLDNAAYALEVAKVPKAERFERARQALELVGLGGWEDRLPQQLSGGMRQRVGLARALAAGTDIMLMDEAFSALDPLIRREMQDQLLELQAKLGKTIVFITHDLNEAMRLGDRIAVMRDGRIVQVGTAEEILTDPSTEYVAQFVADVDRTRVLTAAGVMEPPINVVPVTTGPRAALLAMNESKTESVYVVDRDRRLLGAVSSEAARRAQAAGADTIKGAVNAEDVTVVEPEAPVTELFTPCARSPLPLAVVGEDGRLAGIVPRVTLLSVLGAISDPAVADTAADPADEPPAAEQRTGPVNRTAGTAATGAAGEAYDAGNAVATGEGGAA